MSYYISHNIKRCDRQFTYAKFQVADFSIDVEYFLHLFYIFQASSEVCVKCFNALEKLLKKIQLATAADKQHHTEESTRNKRQDSSLVLCVVLTNRTI